MSNKPNESGYYYHFNGHHLEEIVYVEFMHGSFWVKKLRNNDSYPLSEDKGEFGERIKLPSEEE